MQEGLYPPFDPPALPFRDFLSTLFDALAAEKVRFCVLRNYEGFPEQKSGNDIDFLIARFDLARAVRAVQSIPGVRIAGYLERHSVAMLYLDGIVIEPHLRALEIDFDLGLDWKGLTYLETEAVLQSSQARSADASTYFVPAPEHEAIVSLFASLLVGGWVKERYFSKVRSIFAERRSSVIQALQPRFGRWAANRLVDRVCSGNREVVLGFLPWLRAALVFKSVLREPLRSAAAVWRHYRTEFRIRHAAVSLVRVSAPAEDGEIAERIVEGLVQRLAPYFGQIEKTNEFAVSSASESTGKASAGSHVLHRSLRSRLAGRKNRTLQISSQIVGRGDGTGAGRKRPQTEAPARHSDATMENGEPLIVVEIRNDEARAAAMREIPHADHSSGRMPTQPSMVRGRHIVLDGSRSAEELTEAAFAAILDALAEHGEEAIKRRFSQEGILH